MKIQTIPRPLGIYNDDSENTAVSALCTKFREWASTFTDRISSLNPYNDIYRNLLSMAGGEDANRWHVELAYSRLAYGDPDEPTGNQEEKLLPPGMDSDPLKRKYADEDSTEKLLPPGLDWDPQEAGSESDNK